MSFVSLLKPLPEIIRPISGTTVCPKQSLAIFGFSEVRLKESFLL